jgi:hypothetical protein
MSPEEQQQFTRDIFVQLVPWSGPGYWDWQQLANRAFDAAEQFQVVAIQRVQAQTHVPVDPAVQTVIQGDPTAPAASPLLSPDQPVPAA